ncbi:unnamed protein product [Adineta ricciae]|uniref:Nuclear receptor domain-containing protein n=1 Tax=Adineta ricciae TaxID=249248 RepID=A0A814HWY3_ADIRI|nr:unnamed protein product [Adineta ricciae]CAF1244757.1 unnamed protein product [Adineta ricciae]
MFAVPTDIVKPTTNTMESNFCLVCNAAAHVVHYGAISCYSCKIFFRRHSLRKKNTRMCRINGCCGITERTRKICIPCRLAKCFAVGMSTTLIRKVYQPAVRLPVDKSKQKQTRITSLSLLSNDQSTLRTIDWTLLSNIIHAFDKFTLVTWMHQLITYANSSRLTVNLNVAIDSVALISTFYTAVESFLHATADFQILTIAEQRSLFQRNLHGVFLFCATSMLRNAGILGNSRNQRIVVPVYGQAVVDRLSKISTTLNSNIPIVKLIHIVFGFSTNCFAVTYRKNADRDALLHGSFRLFGSQNVYITILWKYMVYQYGFQESVVRFSTLVGKMLDLISISSDVYNENAYHQILVDDLVENAQAALIANRNESIWLWGRKKDSVVN